MAKGFIIKTPQSVLVFLSVIRTLPAGDIHTCGHIRLCWFLAADDRLTKWDRSEDKWKEKHAVLVEIDLISSPVIARAWSAKIPGVFENLCPAAGVGCWHQIKDFHMIDPHKPPIKLRTLFLFLTKYFLLLLNSVIISSDRSSYSDSGLL